MPFYAIGNETCEGDNRYIYFGDRRYTRADILAMIAKASVTAMCADPRDHSLPPREFDFVVEDIMVSSAFHAEFTRSSGLTRLTCDLEVVDLYGFTTLFGDNSCIAKRNPPDVIAMIQSVKDGYNEWRQRQLKGNTNEQAETSDSP